ncbi:hypothetical protein TELCIR_06515 [Teladorsagia circumcincta]|uniref:Uncharacterized protein n=1 Tax=Teladorsagia circumcincta TaxID=45464 RepID=A0A2G9UMQ9_TELCI|nr:hypothetical protein TELCIR_06515 [Teladorsagia circumcincta]
MTWDSISRDEHAQVWRREKCKLRRASRSLNRLNDIARDEEISTQVAKERQSGDMSQIACVGDGTPGGSISNTAQFSEAPLPGDNGQAPISAGSRTPMYGLGAEVNVRWQNTLLARSVYDN